MQRIGALLLLAACHGGGSAASDTVIPPDVTPETLGLLVTWGANPMLPGELTDKLTVSDATFAVDRFEVLGDFEGATRRLRYPLTWDASTKPAQEAFRDAPPGMYSQVAINLGGYTEHAYEIHGTWRDGSVVRTFKVEDDAPLIIMTNAFMTSLPVAGTAAISIEVQLRDAINGIDFKALGGRPSDDVHAYRATGSDDLELKTGDPQMMGFRMRLAHGFKVSDH